MRKLNMISAMFVMALLVSCGWSDNQKQAARDSIGDGFSQGLEKNGMTVDPEVKEAFLDCVMEKSVVKWESFNEFTDNAAGEELNAIQEACAEEVGLMEAIKPIE